MRTKALLALAVATLMLIPMTSPAARFQSPVPLGTQRILVVPVEFSDLKNSTPLNSISQRMQLVNDYVENASYGKASIEFTVFGRWLPLNRTFTSFAYGINLNGCPGFVYQVVRVAEVDYNLSAFSDLLIVHAGFPNDFYQMRPEENAASNCLGASSPLRGGIAWVSEDDYVTGWTHEVLHAIGGYFQGVGASILRAPDLYDEEAVQAGANSSIYVGTWDIMSSSSGGMTAWTRMKMGWLSGASIHAISAWDNTILNITSLDVASQSVQAIKIPISAKSLILSNGTRVDGSTYYLIEYRTPVGIDGNTVHPTVLVTRANDTRYLEHLSGPLVLKAELVYSTSRPTSFSDNSLNLTISVLTETKTKATLLITTPREYGTINKIQSEVYAAISDASRASAITPLVGLPPYEWKGESDQALAELVSGEFASANITAHESISALSEYLGNTSSFYVYFPWVFDASLFGLLLTLTIGRKPGVGYTRFYVFLRVRLFRIMLLLGFVAPLAMYLQAISADQIVSAMDTYDNTALESGTLYWLLGLAFWGMAMVGAWYLARGSIYDQSDDAEEEPDSVNSTTGGTL